MSEERDIQPADFVRSAWGAVKRGPITVVLRLLGDIATNVVATGLFVTLLFAAFIVLFLGPSPEVVIGVAGVTAAGLGIILALDAFVMAAVWSHGEASIRDEPRKMTATERFRAGFEAFPRALPIRALNFLVRFGVIALLLSWVIPLSIVSADGLWGSEIYLPSAVFGVAGTLYAIGAGLAVLAVEMIAPSHFVGKRSFSDALVDAAATVLENPFLIYRIFVTALGILLPPLVLAWGASLFYAFTFENPEIAPLAAMARSGMNLLLFGAIGLFVVMLQYSFFSYYAHRRGILTTFPPGLFEAKSVEERTIVLADLIPAQVRHRLSIDDVLEATTPPSGSETTDAVVADRSGEAQGPGESGEAEGPEESGEAEGPEGSEGDEDRERKEPASHERDGSDDEGDSAGS